MGIALANKGRLWVKAQGAWGAPATGFADGDLLEITNEFIPPFSIETVDVPEPYAPRSAVMRREAGSKSGGTVSLQIVAHANAYGPEMVLLASLLGGYKSAGAALTQSGGTKAIPETSTASSRVGEAFFFNLDNAAKAPGWTKGGTVSTAPLVVELPDDPASSGSAKAGDVVYEDLSVQAPPFSIKWQGTDDNAGGIFHDCQVQSCTITATAKELVTYDFTVRVGGWAFATGLASAPYAFSARTLPVFIGRNGARLRYGSAEMPCPSSVVVTIENTIAEQVCAAAEEGVAQTIVTDRTISIAITQTIMDFTATPWRDTVESVKDPLQIDLGVDADRAMSIIIPEPVIMEDIDRGATDDMLHTVTTIGPGNYTDETGTGTVKGSLFRMAFFKD